jgi:hypothetical protein
MVILVGHVRAFYNPMHGADRNEEVPLRSLTLADS